VARETLDLYSPLANRLGVWELKWELEDFPSASCIPDTYKKIAKMLDEKRSEREQFIVDAVAKVRAELEAAGVKNAEIYGRPKHIYSIWNKMRKKNVEFSEVYDIRALRIIVDDLKDCYTALGIVHNLWSPISKEFDDYISNPKGNYYRSLHTAVRCPDGRSLEIQIRTWEMHKHAELGVAAHWRYKEGSKRTHEDDYDEKIAWLRQLLTWKDEVADSSDWIKPLQAGRTRRDALRHHAAGQGGRSAAGRDAGRFRLSRAYRSRPSLPRAPRSTASWCRSTRRWKPGSGRDRHRQARWPVARLAESGARLHSHQERAGQGACLVLQPGAGRNAGRRPGDCRQGIAARRQTSANIEELAHKLGFSRADDLYIAAARGEINLRQFQLVARGGDLLAETQLPDEVQAKPSKPVEGNQGILIVGVDKLLTQLARCCKPAPPDEIQGFITRGKGVSVHRMDCPNFANLAALHPERVIETDWGDADDRRLRCRHHRRCP
jgi:GTP pyrophosphokinase